MGRVFLLLSLAALLLVQDARTLWARTLTPQEQRLIEAINSDPQARREALSALQPQAKKMRKLAQTKSHKGLTQVSKTATSAPLSTPTKQDQIAELLQSNSRLPPTGKQYSRCPGFVFFLRQSWKDGNVMGAPCPDPASQAQGAQVSFSDDFGANNRIETLSGTAAVIYNTVMGEVPAPLPYQVSFGGYTTVDDLSNSSASLSKSNVETIAYGGLLSFGFDNSVGANYFMVRAGAVEDFVKGTTAGNAVLDWSPVIYPLYIHYPYHFSSVGIPVLARFDPDLVARFDAATTSAQVLAFNGRHESLRLGPEFALTIVPEPYVAGLFSRFTALLGADFWYEIYSAKPIIWATSSLTYNLDQSG